MPFPIPISIWTGLSFPNTVLPFPLIFLLISYHKTALSNHISGARHIPQPHYNVLSSWKNTPFVYLTVLFFEYILPSVENQFKYYSAFRESLFHVILT